MPGANIPVIGNLLNLLPYFEEIKTSNGPLKNDFIWLFEQEITENGVYDSDKNKALVITLFCENLLVICDPNMVQDIFVTKNKYVDKTGIFQ